MLTFNNKIVLSNDKWIEKTEGGLLPPASLLLRFTDGYDLASAYPYDECVQLSTSPNIWRFTAGYNREWNWTRKFKGNDDLLEVLDGNLDTVLYTESLVEQCHNLTSFRVRNTSSVIYARFMFQSCSSLTKLYWFDTSNITDFGQFLSLCSSLETVPMFDLSSANYLGYFMQATAIKKIPQLILPSVAPSNGNYRMFAFCHQVESGMVDMYNALSAIGVTGAEQFTQCGDQTPSGIIERAQIPSSWGGTGA
jgi:hypothetical protein